jgi:zinc transporter 5/7
MFFDCTALVAGLVASVVSRRPANERFSYGYVIFQCNQALLSQLCLRASTCRYQRAEVLGGLVNGLFLVFVAFFVLKEALEVSLISF